MSSTRLLGLIFVFVLICDKGRTESVIPAFLQDQVPQANENTFSIQIPLGQGNVIQADNQIQSVQRRLSLEDFFLNKNAQDRELAPPAGALQAPVSQFKVEQPDPNSVLLVRDAQFPSNTGGLISRLLMARRMLRLRRIARRLTVIPRLFGLGLRQTLQRAANPNPLSIFSNRMGEAYNPRDFVFGSQGFSYQNNDTQQRDASADQIQQQSRGYRVQAQPFYDGSHDSNYDPQDTSNVRGSNSYEDLDELKQQQELLNSLTEEQQLLLLQQLQNYQQQLNQLHERLNTQPNANQINEQHQQQQRQALNNQQLDQVRQLQLQLLREQQLQQQLQQLQLNQQSQSLRQHQNLPSLEDESNYQDNSNEKHSQNVHDSNTAGDRTEGSSYPSAIGIGGSVGGSFGGGKGIGVGINVGIKPPEVDIHLTKPGVKPLPPIVNPIAHEHVHKPPEVEPLVPIGIFPKPILNLKGRMFFGAEMGKGVGIKTGAGR